MADEEEDDYLNMAIEDTTPAKKETSLQRTARLKKEAAERGKVLSKAERQAKEQESRERALATELDSSNKGAKMMARMGFKGGALGKVDGARTRPIELQIKDDRGGIGLESDKKRKIREAAEAMDAKEKRVKLTADEYRERNRLETEERRHEGQMWSAMRVLEGFETDGDPHAVAHEGQQQAKSSAKVGDKHTPLRSINVLRRPLAKQRMEQEREQRMRNDLAQSLSRRADYNDHDADEDDKLAYGTEIDDDLDEEDPELTDFESQNFDKRLHKILAHLRDKYHYCFWCKYRYPDEEMDGCPGLTEDEHG